MRNADRVAIGWCDPGQVDGKFAATMMRLVSDRSGRLGSTVRVEGSGLISRMRNQIVSTFLDKSDDAWLLMIDVDETLSVPAFDKLVNAAHAEERPIVSGLVFAAFDRGGLYPLAVPTIYHDNGTMFTPLHDYPADTLLAVDAAGTGCLLVHRSVLEHLRTLATEDEGPDYCWFQDRPISGRWHGEDLLFSRKARAAGYPIHCHTGAVLPHRKRYWLTEAHTTRAGA